MIKLNSTFVKSSSKVSECPEANLPEYAFIGRSNVGKSSLINMLTGRKELAKISGKPGKTQLINHFLINEQWFLTDLPGYGYAKTSKINRIAWGKMIEQYLQKRENLVATFLLIDGRHPPMKIDIDFIRWLAENQIAFFIVFTKTDKISKKISQENVLLYRKTLSKDWEELPEMLITSSKTGVGREEIIRLIVKINEDLQINK
jgi:GTP-binding protein